jgi:hypothetical protein
MNGNLGARVLLIRRCSVHSILKRRMKPFPEVRVPAQGLLRCRSVLRRCSVHSILKRRMKPFPEVRVPAPRRQGLRSARRVLAATAWTTPRALWLMSSRRICLHRTTRRWQHTPSHRSVHAKSRTDVWMGGSSTRSNSVLTPRGKPSSLS